MGFRLDRGSWKPVAADLVEILLVDLHQVLAVVDDLAALGDGVLGEDAHDGSRRDGLAGTGLADDGQRLALLKVEADVSHRLDRTVVGAEGDDQVFDFQFLSH